MKKYITPESLMTVAVYGMFVSFRSLEAWVMFFGAWLGATMVLFIDILEMRIRRKRGE